MAENLLALSVRPLDVATPLLQARQIQHAETQNQLSQFNLRQAALGSEARGLVPYVNHPEFPQRWAQSVDRLTQQGYLDPNEASQIRNTPSPLVLQQIIARTSSAEQFIKMQELEQSRAASSNFTTTMGNIIPGSGQGSSAAGRPASATPVLPQGPATSDPTMTVAPRQVAEANGLPAAPVTQPQETPITFGDGQTVLPSTLPPPGAVPAAPVRAPAPPAGPTVNPASGNIGQLVQALSQRGLPKAQHDVGMEFLKKELENAKLTNDQKEYLWAKASGDPEAQRPFTEWMRSNKRASATAITVDQRGETEFEKEFGKVEARRWNGYITAADAAQNKQIDIDNLREIGRRLGSQGAAANVKEALGPYAAALGIEIDGLSDIQAYSSIIQRMAPQQRQPGSGAQSDTELRGFLKSLPGLSLNPAARETITDTLHAINLDDLKRGEIAGRLAAKEINRIQAEKELRALPDPMTGFRQWRKENPAVYSQGLKEAPAARNQTVVPREFQTLSEKEQLDRAPPRSIATINGVRKEKQQDGTWKAIDGR